MSAAGYTLDDLQCDIHNLHHQIDTLVDIMQGMAHDGSEPAVHHRADALAWIARELSEKLAKNIDDNFLSLAGKKDGAK